MENIENQVLNKEQGKNQGKGKTTWVNAVLMPIKQHLGCCILPKIIGAVSGTSTAITEKPWMETALFLTVPPVVTFAALVVEQKIHDARAHKKQAQGIHCEHDRLLTMKNYLQQTGMAFLFFATSHYITHDILRLEHDPVDAKPKTTLVTKGHAYAAAT